MKLPTVKIKKGDGFAIVNERDFDPERHQRFEEVRTTHMSKQAPKRRKAKANGA